MNFGKYIQMYSEDFKLKQLKINQLNQLHKMKKLLLSLALIITVSAVSQNSNPYIIEHCTDKMNGKEYYFYSLKMICKNSDATKGFVINPSFNSSNGTLKHSGIIIKNFGIGVCDEKDTLIILLNDDSKITLTAWNDFNCEGNAYFTITDNHVALLSKSKMSSIRLVNGRSFDSLTVSIVEEDKDYFMKIYTNNKIVEVNCSN